MSLLTEIEDAATGDRDRLPEILRKCKMLASRIGYRPLRDWVDVELGGYPAGSDVPGYRVLRVQSYGHFVGVSRQLQNAPIPTLGLGDDLREMMATFPIRDGVPTCLEHARRNGDLTMPWPPDLVATLSGQFYEGYQLMAAWHAVPRTFMTNILDTVQNRVLDFVLEMGERFPELRTETEPGSLPDNEVSSAFHMVMYGGTANIASGSTNVRQTAVQVPGSIDELRAQLLGLGVPNEDVQELAGILERHDQDEELSTPPDEVNSWIGKITAKAATGAWKVGEGTAVAAVAKAVCGYLGIG